MSTQKAARGSRKRLTFKRIIRRSAAHPGQLYFSCDEWERGDIHHCALGMAANAVGKAVWLEGGDYDAIRAYWPWTKEDIEHPWKKGRLVEALEAIYDTFDKKVMTGEMTFEQFLDWVRSVEPAEEPASEPAPREEAQSVPLGVR